MSRVPSVVSSAQASAWGLSRHAVAHKVDRGHWQRLLRGIYLTHGGSPSHMDWLRAAALWGGPDSVISGAAGLRMRGIMTPRERGILTLVPHERRAHSAGPVRIRRTSRLPDRPQLRNDIHTAPLARCVVDAAGELRGLNESRAVLSAVVQAGWCTVEEVVEELETAGRRGTALLRQALAEVTRGAESVAECVTAEILTSAGITDFEQNVRVFDYAGRFLARADFLWRRLRAILEVDGRAWHLSPAAWEHTVQRHSGLEVAGYSVLHYTPTAITADPQRFVAAVHSWLGNRELLLGTR